jgi:CMP-N-acetylneuraminic acid synthetase
MEKKHIVAIIPARGGSKSIPRKNIKFLNGIPLLAYSIAAAERSKLVDRIIVSTDDEVIADLAREWGAEVPFLRPKELAEDATTDFPVMEHAVRWLEFNEDYRADIVVQLRPTSPLRPPGLVDEAVQQLLQNPNADSVRAITPTGENPFKMWEIEEGIMQPLIHTSLHEAYNMPRQALPATYWQTGHVEAIRFNTIVKKQSLTGDLILPCIVPHEYAVDLDNLQQWAFAAYLLEQGELDVVKPLRRDWFGHKFGQPEGAFEFYKAKLH